MNPSIGNTNISDVIGEKDLPEAIVNGDGAKKENPILDELTQVPEKASAKSVDELEDLFEKNRNFEINPLSNNSIINRIDVFSVNQKALFNCIVRYRFSTLSVRSADAIKSYIESDIGIQGVKFILSDTSKTIKNIRDLGINTICEIHDFINSFDEIIDKVSNYSGIDRIFVKLFKKAKLFEICIEHLKRAENLNPRSIDICVENKLNDLQSIVIYFWAYDDFLKLKNCGQKLNLELIELCRKYELTLRKSIVVLFGKNPNKSFIQKINDYSVEQKSLFNN